MTGFYQCKVVARAAPHAVITTFDASADTREGATVERVTWVLNEPGGFVIRLPLFHPAAPQVQALLVEVQVWRNGVLIHWGVPLQPTLDGQSLVWTCPGVGWYLTRRVFGPIGTNYLLNPLFTSGIGSWTPTGSAIAASWSTAIRLRGPGTARLVSTASGDNYLTQSFSITTGTLGIYLTAAAVYWIDPATTFAATAFAQRGLYMDVVPGSAATAKWEPITMNAPVGVPQRVHVGIQLGPSATFTVEVRLYAPQAAIQWGATSATALESVSSAQTGTDVTEMMRKIVDYAQNGVGKSNVDIGTSTPAAGVNEITAYQFKDLGNCYAALRTYPARGLADFDFVLTSPTTRVFTTYAPRKGSLKSGYGLTVPGTSVLNLGYRADGQQTASKTIRRGPSSGSSGSDREVGVATDTSKLAGLILEDVGDAPPEVNLDGLDSYATTELGRLSDVVTFVEGVVPAATWMGNVVVGDTVPCSLNWGAIQDSTTRRVIAMELEPVSDTIKPTLQVA